VLRVWCRMANGGSCEPNNAFTPDAWARRAPLKDGVRQRGPTHDVRP